MSPRQVLVIPVAEAFHGYAKEIRQELLHADFYAGIDDGSDSFNKKIRNGEMEKWNYILIV